MYFTMMRGRGRCNCTAHQHWAVGATSGQPARITLPRIPPPGPTLRQLFYIYHFLGGVGGHFQSSISPPRISESIASRLFRCYMDFAEEYPAMLSRRENLNRLVPGRTGLCVGYIFLYPQGKKQGFSFFLARIYIKYSMDSSRTMTTC